MPRVLSLCLAICISLPASSSYAAVGFQRLTVQNPGGEPVEVGVWYPADGQPVATLFGLVASNAAPIGDRLPLIVISHGLGGAFANHRDTAQALAEAGFVAAALTHAGDNWRKPAMTGGDPALRPRELKLVIDHMLSNWGGHERLDPQRVGAFGFSLGGFTVLAAAGGKPDLAGIRTYCEARPAEYTCRVEASAAPARGREGWTHDPRIQAVVAAAPALGFTFGREGLAQVKQPVQLWLAEHDTVVPEPDHVEAVRAALPVRPEVRLAKGAHHFDFIAPCGAELARRAPEICTSGPSFDRAAFHADFNREVVGFFRRTLGRRP